MKNATFTFLLLLFTNLIFAQYMDEESQIVQEFKLEKQNTRNKIIGDITGICDAMTIVTNQGAGIGWDDCEGNTYEGTVEFESVDGQLYNIYSISNYGDNFNDLSFGAFYACYGSDDQSGMPNADASAPTLYFNVNGMGELSFSGSSQWGEIFSVSDIEMDGAELSFNWTNDYGEGASVQLERQDGQIWENLLTPCMVDLEDSLALVALYNANDGPNWNIPWDLNVPVSEWYGITIDQTSCRVAEIDMGRSSELNALGFIGNNLSGEVPDEIGNLTELTLLDLSDNQLEGEVLSKLTSLINLEILSLANNAFTGTIIPELSNLVNLEILFISANNLEGELPSEVSTMSELSLFLASRNSLIGEIPVEFGEFQSLRSLSMWGNNLTGNLPSELGNIETLQNLNLGFNNLSGEIPASLGEIPFLSFLRLSFNELSGTIPEGFPFLVEVQLNNNNLSGEVPQNFATLFGINEINFSNNNLSGSFPSRFILNDSFQELYFSNNDFSGCVDSIENLCLKPYNPVLDTINVNGMEYYASYSRGYDFGGNPKLAWEGNIQNACIGEDQIGAPCNDGDPNTTNDGIDANCDCAQIVSTKDIEELNEITISPNPLQVGDPININLDLNENIRINMNILDLNGKVILNTSLELNSGSNSVTLESNDLSSGLYLLQLSSKNSVTSRKIVVQ